MISALLKLFGCSGQEKKMTDRESDEMQKVFEDFEKRPIYKVLTVDIVKNIKDENLEQAIIDNIQTKFNKDFSNEGDVVRSLSKGQKAIYVTWILEAEVNNGGFNQFYFNSSGKLADLGEGAFKTIGAIQFADLVGQANSIYDVTKEDLEKYDDGTIESFSKSYDQNPLNDLDEKFYKLYKDEPLNQIKVKYIRDNVKEFVTE
jgi:Domain of unknown function (DUF4375)